MIDERHEELAALYALDLLEGTDRAQFEAALARDPALQALVRDLRESSAALAHTAPAVPPPAALRHRRPAAGAANRNPAPGPCGRTRQRPPATRPERPADRRGAGGFRARARQHRRPREPGGIVVGRGAAARTTARRRAAAGRPAQR